MGFLKKEKKKVPTIDVLFAGKGGKMSFFNTTESVANP